MGQYCADFQLIRCLVRSAKFGNLWPGCTEPPSAGDKAADDGTLTADLGKLGASCELKRVIGIAALANAHASRRA